MAESKRRVLLSGDPSDPWVAAIAAALPADTVRLPAPWGPGPWPDEAGAAATVLVVHRDTLSDSEAAALDGARREGRFSRLILCVGPLARYHQVQRWAATGLADVVLPEAIAAEVVGRYLDAQPAERPPAPRRGRPQLALVSGQFELSAALAAACADAGYPTIPARDWRDAPRTPLAVWDVPVLEPGWAEELASAARHRRSIVALVPFADRGLVSQARACGAAACLDLPCDPADLVFVLDRLAGYWVPTRLEEGHELPPRRHGTPSKRPLMVDRDGGS